MKYIHKRILKWLRRIRKYFIKFCTTVQHIWSNGKVAKYRYFVFFSATALLVFIAISTTWLNWSTVVVILMPSNNMLVLYEAIDYCKFTCLYGIFIFLCLFYINYFLYLDKRAELSSRLVSSLIYLLLFCIVIVGTVWCLSIYYGYVCMIQINIIYSLESLTGVWLIGIIFGAPICLASVYILANIYGKKYPVLIIIRAVATLLFFNLVIAHIFGTFLYFDSIFFQVTVFNSEVCVYAILTICYLCHLFTRGGITEYLAISEWYGLAAIAGFTLGLQLCFYTPIFNTCLFNNILVQTGFWIPSLILLFSTAAVIILCRRLYTYYLIGFKGSDARHAVKQIFEYIGCVYFFLWVFTQTILWLITNETNCFFFFLLSFIYFLSMLSGVIYLLDIFQFLYNVTGWSREKCNVRRWMILGELHAIRALILLVTLKTFLVCMLLI